MQTAFATDIFYDGSQLRSGFISETFGLSGDAIVAFTGGCDVSPEHMLDLEDLEAGQSIRARLMLHFIVEHYGMELPLAVARQRLLAALVREVLADEYSISGITREGDDLYLGRLKLGPSAEPEAGGRKLSISVAVKSPVSGLIHFAMNIDPTDAPVPAVGLRELGLQESAVATVIQKAYVTEIASCERAASKVRAAK
ncbi:MAG: DUF366 family protein [Armatimonadia bacterium]